MDKTSTRPQRIVVITSVERRRQWVPAEKKAIIDETYPSGMMASPVARKHGVPPNQLFYSESELKKAMERIKPLERLLGQKTEKVECLKEAV